MKQQPDNLFRERFEQHSLQAPETAWSRIEQTLPVQQHNFFYLKIAAAIILLIISIALLLPSTASTTQQLTLKENTPFVEKPVIKQKAFPVDTAGITRSHDTPAIQNIVKDEPVLIKQNREAIPVDFIISQPLASTIETTVAQVKESSVQPTLVEETTTLNPNESFPTTVEVIPLKEKSSTIIVASAEVNEKYLRPILEEEATNTDVSTSSFRKLLDKAADLKNNDTGFGELRDKKNELLALNRERNEKRERNN